MTIAGLHEDVEPRFIQEKPPPMETFQKMEQIRQAANWVSTTSGILLYIKDYSSIR